MRTQRWGRSRGLALGVALMATLAACGSDDGGNETEAPEETPAEETDGDTEEPAGDDGDTEAAAGGETECGTPGGPFEGELLEISLNVSPGGGYDTYARAIAPFLGEELGADTTVSNNPGAGGLLNLNNFYASGEDENIINFLNGTGTLGAVLGGADGVEFELDQMQWLGRLAAEPRVFNVHAGVPYESVEDVIGLEEEFTFATTGPGGGSHIAAAILMEALDMKGARFVSGFEGSAESNLAVVAGEVDGDANTASTSLPFVESGDQRVLVIIGDEPLEDMYPGVPTLFDIGLEGEQLQIAESLVAINSLGRTFAAPPAMPEDKVAELRRALECVVMSEELQEEFETQDLVLDWRDGEAVEQIVNTAMNTPESVRQILAENA